MPLYYGDHGLINVQTTGPAVYQLPYSVVLVTGVTPPAAAPGAKSLSGKLRMRGDTYCQAGLIKSAGGTGAQRQTATCDLHIGTVRLDGVLKQKQSAPRCELSSFQSTTVTFVAAGTAVAANNASAACTAPTRIVGDFLLAVGFSRALGTIGTSTAGWTEATNSGGTTLKFFWRIADGTSADNITITITGGGSNNTVIGQIFSYRTVHATQPFCDRIDGGGPGADSYFASAGGLTNTFPFAMGGDYNFPTIASVNLVTGAMAFTAIGLDNDNTNASPSLNDGGGNSAAEAALFPFTRRGSFATTLGSDASLLAFDASNTAAPQPQFAASAFASYTTTGAAYALSCGLRPTLTGSFNTTVWLDGAPKQKQTATCGLTVQVLAPPKNLDGVLHQVQSLTGALTAAPGTFLDGVLQQRQSTIFTLQVVNNRIDAILRQRSVANLTLTIGTTHKPSALLVQRQSLTGALTLNYMQAVLRTRWTTSCWLSVNKKLAGTAVHHQTASAALSVLRAFAAVAPQRQSATARLTTPLRGGSACRATANLALTVQRRVAGAAAARSTASMNLHVVRRFQMFAQQRQAAAATLTTPRLLAARAGQRQSASAALTLDRRLAGFLPCRVTARLSLDLAYPPPSPIGAEITVSPYTVAIEHLTSSVQIESAHDAANVEDGE